MPCCSRHVAAGGRAGADALPGWTLIPPHDARSARIAATQQAITDGATVLFEAAFEADSIFISADVLEKTERGWRLFQVKSALEP